jgi:hypothetical protein
MSPKSLKIRLNIIIFKTFTSLESSYLFSMRKGGGMIFNYILPVTIDLKEVFSVEISTKVRF